ncbi:hypothetical protein [Marichromatium bheemlicum]|uniref:Immunity protein 49 of polymorphic toxin system n=1 Tax=Marichromatium bheemlicum TaxID=365339 RepID=A0ABX1I9G2_9GAMM|nr:hypothetical protein [Marichromatium bheemlicum]NKN33878.1 hypothetical protein [Marichromatium bheemlicum]
MSQTTANGTRREIDGDTRVHYDGYWIKYYEPPADTLETKRQLIQALTRRLFNHVEHGINIPGARLDEARAAYEAEDDPARKRVNGAMLAGALFNRAADIFSCLVELQATGVEIGPDNSLMRECGHYLLEALELGKIVRHRGGDEGIDELWGEPFKAFSMPIATFYESRYIKIAMTMRDIDRIATAIRSGFAASRQFPDIGARIDPLAETAKRKCEILRTDPSIFEVWPAFAVASDRLCELEPQIPANAGTLAIREALEGSRLLCEGAELIRFIVRARVPMPKSTHEYIDRCVQFRQTFFGPTADERKSPSTTH